jgi:succinoglycan biosynthesis protein ExoA
LRQPGFIASARDDVVLDPVHKISVVAPIRNEAEHIDHFIRDLAGQDYEGELEIFMADGRSSDDSVERLAGAAETAGLSVTVLENPAGWVSQGLNACIDRATGDLIVRLDCHSRYPTDYLRRCAVAAEETGAENVGGVLLPRGRMTTERAVACASDNPFGGIGWRIDASTTERIEVDTVTYGAFRPRAFELAGRFDESLVRNQDDEFNLRLRKRGGRIVLDPAIRVFYTPRGSLRGAFRQYYEYGVWKVPVMLKHRQVASLRSLAPFGFVASLPILGLLAVWRAEARLLLLIELATYVLGALVFAAIGIGRRHESWRILPRVVAAFMTFHVAYGIGMAKGWLDAAMRVARVQRRREIDVADSLPAEQVES